MEQGTTGRRGGRGTVTRAAIQDRHQTGAGDGNGIGLGRRKAPIGKPFRHPNDASGAEHGLVSEMGGIGPVVHAVGLIEREGLVFAAQSRGKVFARGFLAAQGSVIEGGAAPGKEQCQQNLGGQKSAHDCFGHSEHPLLAWGPRRDADPLFPKAAKLGGKCGTGVAVCGEIWAI